jgi:hypothetical protein
MFDFGFGESDNLKWEFNNEPKEILIAKQQIINTKNKSDIEHPKSEIQIWQD